jgi:hypothetical protein
MKFRFHTTKTQKETLSAPEKNNWVFCLANVYVKTKSHICCQNAPIYAEFSSVIYDLANLLCAPSMHLHYVFTVLNKSTITHHMHSL